MKALDVVIVSFRCRELLRECLSSLRAHPPTGRELRVVVVDNASRDGTPDMVRAEFPEVDLVAADRNLGFARAANLGLSRGEAEYALLLNPDTRVTAGALDACLAVLERDPRVGCCGCRLLRPDGRLDHACRRGFPTPLTALAYFTGLGPLLGGRLDAYRAPHVQEGPVDAVNGAFMLLRRRALEEVGFLDEGYWMYMEDLDLCYRLAQAGWLTWYEPRGRVVHLKGASAGRPRPPGLTLAFHRGMLRFYRKHQAPRRSLVVNAAVYAGIAVKLGAALARSGGVLVARRIGGPWRRPQGVSGEA